MQESRLHQEALVDELYENVERIRSSAPLPRLRVYQNRSVATLQHLQHVRRAIRSPLSLDKQLCWNPQPRLLYVLFTLHAVTPDPDICFYGAQL